MTTQYKLTEYRFGHPAGTIVYEFHGHDYGLARDDSLETGDEHMSVTDKENGEGPFFTVRVDHLELVK